MDSTFTPSEEDLRELCDLETVDEGEYLPTIWGWLKLERKPDNKNIGYIVSGLIVDRFGMRENPNTMPVVFTNPPPIILKILGPKPEKKQEPKECCVCGEKYTLTHIGNNDYACSRCVSAYRVLMEKRLASLGNLVSEDTYSGKTRKIHIDPQPTTKYDTY